MPIEQMSLLVQEQRDSAWSTDCWNTPPDVMDRVHRYWPGGISLDPCANEWSIANGFVRARTAWTVADDCLSQATWKTEERTTVWFQPPYSAPLEFVRFLCSEWDKGLLHEALALVKLDTSTRWFRELETRASSIVLFNKRLEHYQGYVRRRGSDFCSVMLSMTPSASAKARRRALTAAFDGLGRVWA